MSVLVRCGIALKWNEIDDLAYNEIRLGLKEDKMTTKTKRTVKNFIVLLIGVALFGAIVALTNQWFRSQGYNSTYMTAILTGCTSYGYYRAWLWLCRKLDLLDKKSK